MIASDPREIICLIPAEAKKDLDFIFSSINSAGHECYVVGGASRDLLIGNVPVEYDIATSAYPEEIKKIFRRVVDTGIKHGTVTVILGSSAYEVTTYRKDIDYTDGRRPDKVEFGATLSEDLKRRDFTINAIALDIVKLQIVDEHSGIRDINDKIIRAIGDPVMRFTEDGLRPIRAIRLSATLGFSIEENTYAAIRETRHVTEKISIERFHDELNKILVSGNPEKGISELFRNEIFSLFVPEKVLLEEAGPSLPFFSILSKNPLGLRLSLLLNLLTLNEQDSPGQSLKIVKSLKYSKVNSGDALFFLKFYRNIPEFPENDFVFIRKFLHEFLKYTGKENSRVYLEAFYSLLPVFFNPEKSARIIRETEEISGRNFPLLLSDLSINGNIIMEELPEIEKRGIGSLLQLCLDAVIETPENNNKEFLLNLIRNTDRDRMDNNEKLSGTP